MLLYMDYDIAIIGAGPAGLSFAASLGDSGLKVAVIEKSPKKVIANPKQDGREWSNTHQTRSILTDLGVWEKIDPNEISPIAEAKVFDGDSPSLLNFKPDDPSIDALGYLVPSEHIKKALFEAVIEQKNIHFLFETSVEDIKTDDSSAKLTLGDGSKLEVSLVVAADSRFSSTRRKMGIPTVMKDYSKTMIITRMSHENPHNGAALEWFDYGQTLALLPLSGNTSSVVWTVENSKADEILGMTPKKFNKHLTELFKNEFGSMEQIGERFSYPLSGVASKTFIAKRFALIGDAAVATHPVTAHGYNLGIRAQHLLAKEIKNAIASSKDFASHSVLKKYEDKSIHFAKIMFYGTDTIVSLFTNDSKPVRKLRRFVLNFAEKFPPVKQLITRQLTERKNNLFPF